MEPAALPLGQMWRFAVEFTLFLLLLSGAAAAAASMLLLGIAGLVTDGIPRLRSYVLSYTVPYQIERVSKAR